MLLSAPEDNSLSPFLLSFGLAVANSTRIRSKLAFIGRSGLVKNVCLLARHAIRTTRRRPCASLQAEYTESASN